jgi:lysophospholipase L1-like esterase
MRIAAGVCTAWTLCVASACTTANPVAPTEPLAPRSAVIYSVVGASDVIGYGSSQPCFVYDDCNGTGYAWVAARQLRTQAYAVNVAAVGIPGAVISRAFQDLAVSNGRTDIFGNFIDQEAPFVRREASLVTVFAGGNDVNVITQALDLGRGAVDQNAYIDQQVAMFKANYLTLISLIRTRAPNARIVVLNLPNMAGMPYHAQSSLTMKRWAQRAAVGMTTTGINTLTDIKIVDLMCDPRFYDAANFSEDGFHPNDALYAIMGTSIADAATSSSYPAPRASCPQMAIY